MERIELPFEQETIKAEEMKEHTDWYFDKLMTALKEKEAKQKIILFKRIKNALEREAKHYQKSEVEKAFKKQSQGSLEYCETILEIEKNSGYQNEELDQVIDRLLNDFIFYKS